MYRIALILALALFAASCGGRRSRPQQTACVSQPRVFLPAIAPARLSPQEQRVLALIAEGKTNKEVAMVLNLSEKTVKNYLANMFDKLEVTRRAQAAAMFAKNKAVLAGTPGGT